MARNQAIDKTRSKELIKSKKTSDLENVVSKVDRSSSTEMSVESIGLENVLSTLPPEQKFVVEHLYLKGYTQSELADEFNLPLGTVKTRLRLGMEHLRKVMGIK